MMRHFARAAAVLLALPVCQVFVSPGHAQNDTQGVGKQPSQQQAQVSTAPPDVPEEYLFGDLGGLRKQLYDAGYTILLDYTTESAGNITGGRRSGFDYAHQIGLQADLDWGRIAGLNGFSTHAVVVQRAGRNLSTDYIGDNLLQVQEIYGGGGDVAAHFVYLYGEQSLAGGRVDIVAGRIPLEQDFAASPLYCNFMSVSICGNPHALSVNTAFSNWPESTWGGRVRVLPTAETYIQIGAYEVNPDYGGRSGWSWFNQQSTGVVLPIELAWQPVFGADKLPGHYKIGFGWDSSRYPDNLDGTKRHHGLGTGYALADQMLIRTGPAYDDGLIALAAYVHGDGSVTQFQDYAVVGLVDRGPLPFRPRDTVGLLFAYAKVSNRITEAQNELLAAGELLPAGVYGPQSHEMIIEANYNIHAFRGVDIMPDFQYVIRPGGTNRIPDAAVLGLKTHIQF